MIAKVGAAARDSRQPALALGHSRSGGASESIKLGALAIISAHLPLSHCLRRAFIHSSCDAI
jgi:hypothetical protein